MRDGLEYDESVRAFWSPVRAQVKVFTADLQRYDEEVEKIKLWDTVSSPRRLSHPGATLSADLLRSPTFALVKRLHHGEPARSVLPQSSILGYIFRGTRA